MKGGRPNKRKNYTLQRRCSVAVKKNKQIEAKQTKKRKANDSKNKTIERAPDKKKCVHAQT